MFVGLNAFITFQAKTNFWLYQHWFKEELSHARKHMKIEPFGHLLFWFSESRF